MKYLRILSILLLFLLPVLIAVYVNGVKASNATTATGSTITKSYFGMHFRSPQSAVSLPYGTCRIWGVRGASWPDIESSPGVYNYTTLDGMLAAAQKAGITDGCVFTFGYFPQWASTNPSDTTCAQVSSTSGGCWPPADLNFDGSGTDQTVVDAISHIAAHVNDPTYLQTHAHIKYWEPFNEPYQSSVISGTICASTHRCSFNGSYAQLVRIAEDMRCAIKGQGSVNGVPCTRTAIDPSALIMTPSGQTYFQYYGRLFVANFLNCSYSPRTGSGCTSGSRGSAAVDVINFHCYVPDGNADEEVANIRAARALLSLTDAAKPFLCDEGSWGRDANISDPDLQAGFVPRWFVGIFSQGVASALWYSWDDQYWGTLWNPFGKNGCTQTAGCLTKAGVAYAQTQQWLSGATFQGCGVNNGIEICKLSRTNGYSALLVWATTTLTSCTNQVNQNVCGSTLYNVPTGYITKLDLSGNRQPANSIEYVGAKPLLLQNQ